MQGADRSPQALHAPRGGHDAAMTALHEDPRVARGMERQLELRRRMLDEGARSIGWKLGLGTPAADGEARHERAARRVPHRPRAERAGRGARDRRLGQRRPRSRRSRCTSPRTSPPAGIATRSPRPSAGSASRSRWSTSRRSSSRRSSPATSSTATCCSGRPRRSTPARCSGRIAHGDALIEVDDPWALVGDPVDALAHLATHLAAFGETVRAGEVLITGSIVPALSGRAGRRDRLRAGPARRAVGDVHGVAAGPGAAAILRGPSRRWRNW